MLRTKSALGTTHDNLSLKAGKGNNVYILTWGWGIMIQGMSNAPVFNRWLTNTFTRLAYSNKAKMSLRVFQNPIDILRDS